MTKYISCHKCNNNGKNANACHCDELNTQRLNKKGSLIWIDLKGNDESFGDMDIPTMYLMDEDGY